MMDFKRLQLLDLSTRSALVEIKDTVEELVDQRLRRESFEFLRGLQGRLRYMNPEQLGPLAFDYESLMVKLKFACFAELSENDAVKLIQQNAVDIFSTSLDLNEQLHQRIIEIPFFQRDDFKKKIRDALIRNQQPLTSKTIVLGADNIPQRPTVENWIRDFTYHVGSDILDPLQITAYFSRNPNVMALSPMERQRVRKILLLLDRFKYPSTVLEGLDEAVKFEYKQRLYLAIDGQIVAIGNPKSINKPTRAIGGKLPPLRPQPLPEQRESDVERILLSLVQRHLAEDETRFQEQERLLKQVGTDVEKLLTVLKEAIVVNDTETIVVCAAVLARSGSIASPLQSKAVRDALDEEFLYALADRDNVTHEVVRKALDSNRDDPKFVSAWLWWLLRRALHNDEAESARIGNQLENTLTALGQTEYAGMTYFDITAGGYRWTPLRVKPDGMLEWAE